MTSAGSGAELERNRLGRGKTLFLDFDGVLHPSLSAQGRYFERMDWLVRALDRAAVDVVISSSWRFHHAFGDLQRLLPVSLRPQVVGCTGPVLAGRHARWREITAYCATHRVREWRALDDSAFEFPAGCPELILCDGSRGLDERQVSTVRRWLAGT
jgi:hypothetical protein